MLKIKQRDAGKHGRDRFEYE